MDELQFLTSEHKLVHRMVLGTQLWGEVLVSIFSCILVLLKSPSVQYFQLIGCFWPVKKQKKREMPLLWCTWILFDVGIIVQIWDNSPDCSESL